MAMPKYVCTACCCTDKPIKYRRGRNKREILLWICFIVPGLLYTIWRNTSTILACPRCETTTMISTKTPHGQRLIGA